MVCTDREEERGEETCQELFSVCLLHWKTVLFLCHDTHTHTPLHSFWGLCCHVGKPPHRCLATVENQATETASSSSQTHTQNQVVWMVAVEIKCNAMWGCGGCCSRQPHLLLLQATSEEEDRRLLFLRTLPHHLDTHAASPSIRQTCSAALPQASRLQEKMDHIFFFFPQH